MVTLIPEDREPYVTDAPLIVVTQDAPGNVRSRVNNRVQLRVLTWHKTKDDAFDLSQLAHALAVVHSGPSIRSVRPLLSPYGTKDPDTREPLASFTVMANVRASVLTA